MKKVNQLDDGDIIATFNSMSEAEQITDIRASSISLVVHGKMNHAGGYEWEFTRDENEKL